MILLPEWDCGACALAQQRVRGCTSPATGRLTFRGEPIVRCPRRPLLDQSAWFGEFFWLYQNYKDGMLPEGSSMKANPHLLMQAIRVFDGALVQAKAERDAKENAKRAR